jgi:SOS-response transcriptional repressor LexA
MSRPLLPPYRRPLTPRQRDVLRFLRAFYAENGYPPTQREIARALGIKSPATVNMHLRRLASLGEVERLYRGGRCYWPADSPTRGTS